ncbi:hypothetical protein LTR94_032990, partial [Friedmanniomyces endolithicus]
DVNAVEAVVFAAGGVGELFARLADREADGEGAADAEAGGAVVRGHAADGAEGAVGAESGLVLGPAAYAGGGEGTPARLAEA